MKNSSQEILPSWCWHARQDHLRSSRWHRKLLCMALNWTIKISQISNCKSCNKISLCVVLNIRMTCKGQKSFLSHHRNYCCCSHNTWYCVTALSWYKIDFIPAPCWFSSCHNCHQGHPKLSTSGAQEHTNSLSIEKKQREIELVKAQHVSCSMRRSFWLVNPMGVVQNHLNIRGVSPKTYLQTKPGR